MCLRGFSFMFFIEWMIKKLKEKKDYSRRSVQSQEEEHCEHIFIPIDSTKEVLACSKCGLVIHKNQKIIPKNPFFEI